MNTRITLAASALACLGQNAVAQSVITRHVFASGGGQSIATTHTLTATIGQSFAGSFSAATHTINTGFWIGSPPPAACYANCDTSTGTPLLTGNDFACFIAAFANALSYANCDGSTGTPALTGNDFACFIAAYAAGCT